MINPDAKLNANIFEKPDMASSREGFGRGVVEAGRADERVPSRRSLRRSVLRRLSILRSASKSE